MGAYEELMEQVNKLVQPEEEVKNRFTACKCGFIGVHPANVQPKTTCPKCAGLLWVGNTEDEAKAKAMAEPKAEPKEEPKAEPKEEPKVEVVKVVRKKAKPKVEPKVEIEDETEDEAEEETEVKPDWKKAREEAVRKVVEEYKLNEFSPVPIGTAIVQALGFTFWQDKKPNFRFMEPFEEPIDFRQVYDAARAEQPATRIDVARCSDVDNELVRPTLYCGEAIVQLNNGSGIRTVKAGTKIKIGAVVSANGSYLRFVIM